MLAINRSAQRLFGVTQEECVNHDIITVNRNQVLKEALEEALAGKESEKLLELGGPVTISFWLILSGCLKQFPEL